MFICLEDHVWQFGMPLNTYPSKQNNLFVEPTTLHLLKLCDPKGTLKYQIAGDRLSSILHFCSKLHADTLWLHGEWLRLDGSTIVKLSEIIGDIFI